MAARSSKRRQYFIRAHDETLSVVAMSACNQDQNAMASQRLESCLDRLRRILATHKRVCRVGLLLRFGATVSVRN